MTQEREQSVSIPLEPLFALQSCFALVIGVLNFTVESLDGSQMLLEKVFFQAEAIHSFDGRFQHITAFCAWPAPFVNIERESATPGSPSLRLAGAEEEGGIGEGVGVEVIGEAVGVGEAGGEVDPWASAIEVGLQGVKAGGERAEVESDDFV